MKRKIYITKYALTQGIIEADADFRNEGDTICNAKYGVGRREFFHKDQYSFERSDAVVQATSMRDKRIKSLTKQLNKLQKLDFNL